jgi:hypothetical protein
VKGLYLKAIAGEITGFTGVDDPYQEPSSPEIYIDTMNESPDESLQKILDELGSMGLIEETQRLVGQPNSHSGFTDLDGTIGTHLAGRHSASQPKEN